MVTKNLSKACCFDRVVGGLEVHLDSAARFLSRRTGRKIRSCEMIFVIAVAFVLAPFDLVQITFMVLGAVCYALISAANVPLSRARRQRQVDSSYSRAVLATPEERTATSRRNGYLCTTPPQVTSKLSLNTSTATMTAVSPNAMCTTSNQTPTIAATGWGEMKCPVKIYQFESPGWESAVQELLRTLRPNAETEATVRSLAEKVRSRLCSVLPGLEVDGFASAQIDQRRSFGVAVPNVELVVRLPTGANGSTLGVRPALRLITQRLVDGTGEFKFRRSSFRGEEPKVILLATSELGTLGRAVPLEVSVNAKLSRLSQALLAECQRLEPRSHDLYRLVRQWSKERGVSYAPQGHLSPYLWCLLTVYYLQTGVKDEGTVLPKFLFDLKGEGPASVPSVRVSETESSNASSAEARRKKSLAALFKDFFHFYSSVFDWSADIVDVRASVAFQGKPPAASERPLVHGVHIEDPLTFGKDLGASVSEVGGRRLREEFSRASELCRRGQSLQELLQVWAPTVNDNAPSPDSGNAHG